MIKWRWQYHTQSDTNHMTVDKLHNFSSYLMSPQEITTILFAVYQHILYDVDNISINTEFELFCQNLLQDSSHLPEHTLSWIKVKLCYTCEKYCNIKTTYKYKRVIQSLREYQNIVIWKPDKGVVFVNQNTYTDKSFLIFNSSQFTQLNHDPTDKFERKLQENLT